MLQRRGKENSNEKDEQFWFVRGRGKESERKKERKREKESESQREGKTLRVDAGERGGSIGYGGKDCKERGSMRRE